MAEIWASNERLVLRPMTAREVPLILSYERAGDEQGFVVHQTLEQHLAVMLHSDIQYGIFVDRTSLAPAGYVIIAGLCDAHRNIELRRIVMFEPGKGFGRSAMTLLKIYGFETLNAHRLWLDVRAHNERALYLYRTEGFVDEGVLREAVFWNDHFVSVVVLSILEQEYRKLGGMI